jgi:hypothetical protein
VGLARVDRHRKLTSDHPAETWACRRTTSVSVSAADRVPGPVGPERPTAWRTAAYALQLGVEDHVELAWLVAAGVADGLRALLV